MMLTLVPRDMPEGIEGCAPKLQDTVAFGDRLLTETLFAGLRKGMPVVSFVVKSAAG
jgi:hypothetical protein